MKANKRGDANGCVPMVPGRLGSALGIGRRLFNCWLTRKLLVKEMSNKRIIALVIIKPLTHLVILVSAMFVSAWFMLLAAAGDLLTLGVLFVKSYLDGRR